MANEYLEGLTDDELYALATKLAYDVKDAQKLGQEIGAEIAKRRGDTPPADQIKGSLTSKILAAKAAQTAVKA
jgi:hypothetical protein